MGFILAILMASALPNEEPRSMEVRLTKYWNDPITANGNETTPYKTVAVDPKLIPYGSRIEIPELGLDDLIADDTGSAVINRTASKKVGKNCPVVDLYVGSKREYLRHSIKWPHFVTIIIHD